MKLIKPSLICTLIFMIGSLDFINAKPYPKLNLGNPFIKKKRRLIDWMIFLKYNANIYNAFQTYGVQNYYSDRLISPDDTLKLGFISLNGNDYTGDYINMEKFFYTMDSNCEKIRYIYITDFKPGQKFFNTLFYGCPNVEEAFLSHLYDDPISDFDSIFGNLKNLKTLDISGLKFTGTGPSFSNNPNLKYIDITGATLSDAFKKNVIDNYDDLIICQDSPSLIKSNYIYSCCDYINKNGMCIPDNYMKIYLKSDTSQFDFTNYPKDNIRFVLSGQKYYSKDQLKSKTDVNKELIIYFLKPLETLESFFEGQKKIESIDLSKLDFSSIVSAKNMFKDSSLKTITLPSNTRKLTDMASMFENTPLEQIDLSFLNLQELTSMESMFKGSSLKTIKLSNINIPLLTNMNSTFKNSLLKKIDLSNIKTSVTNMASMFENCTELLSVKLNGFIISKEINIENFLKGCKNLKVLEALAFNFGGIKTTYSLFETFPNLKYLNLKDVIFIDGIREQFKNIIFSKNETIICLNDDYLSKVENKNNFSRYECCNFLLDVELCESFNYIKVKYDESINYEKGFGNVVRNENLIYVKNGEKAYKPNIGFTIENTDIELVIAFSEAIKSLKDFFNSEKDLNVKKIESIDFTNFNTSNLTDMNSLFKGCNNVKIINYSNFDTSLVTDMSNLFNGCEKLISVNLSKFNTEIVTNMNSMFANCSSLKSIDLFNFKTSKVIDMGSMFANCSSLKSIDLFNFNTSNVIDMGSMFEGCEQLEIIKLFYFNTSSVTDMSKMFSNCNNLVFIDISNFKMQSVTKYEDMFKGDFKNTIYVDLYNVEDSKEIITYSGLNKVNKLNVCQKEDLITNENAKITCCYYDFENKKCRDGTNNLFKITFATDVNYKNGFSSDIREKISYILDKVGNTIFQKSENLTFIAGNLYDVYLESPIEKLENYFNSQKDQNTKKIKSIGVILPDSSSVQSLESMFYGCSSLESVYILDIDTSSVKSFTKMFRECSSLKSIDLTLFNTESAKNMNQMFYKCQSLKYIDVSNFNTSSVKTMDQMFAKCSSLEYLDLSYFDTSLTYSMIGMFFMNNNLKVLDISSFNTDEISDNSRINDMFYGVLNLKYINLYNMRDTKNYIKNTYLKNIQNLTICQKENIVISEKNAYYNCCYYDIKTNKCEIYNYMFIYYDKYITYEKGFSFIENNAITLRKEKYFIINKDYFNKINGTNRLIIKKGSKLGIYFSSEVTTLEDYFNADIDENALYLKKVILSHLDIYSVQSTSKMFYKCGNLKFIVFPNIEVSTLTNMNKMFYLCASLEEVDASYFNPSLVKDMESMFEGCRKLEILDLSSFDTSSVNNIARMFSGCENLKYLDISNFNLQSIDNIKGIFTGISSLQYLYLYNAKKVANKNLKIEEPDSFKNLLVCQKEQIITKNGNDECCYHNTSCESSNFIIIYFERETIYEKGFISDNNGNVIREGKYIDFIINGKHSIKLTATDKLIIRKGKRIELYFKPGITTLESYFSVSKDPNLENVASIDLSHFNTSSVTNMASMFSGCHSLKSIDLYDIVTSSVTDMNKMFNDCKALETLDLSSFDTSLVTNMDSMFNGCESLIYLDISNFNLENIKNFNSVFTGVDNLLYVNLYYVKNTYNNITESELNNLGEVTVCQKDYLVTNEKATYNCCYYDIEKKECLNDNFVVLYFDKDTTYESGFNNIYRNGTIDFIINREHYSKLSDTDKFRIKKGQKIEVYFSSNLASLSYYFSGDYDKNMRNVSSISLSNLKTSSVINMRGMFSGSNSIKSIDFSNIDTSKVTDMGYMFYGCSSLESIDLSYFDTSLVEKIDYMFYECSLLKIIDLSYFNTSSIINMESMFSYCNSLQLLDLSRFNLEALENEEPMFKNTNNLTYINLYYTQDSKGYITKSINNENSGINISNLIVCQKENIIENVDNKCCYYNIENKECQNNNYITIFFGDKALYDTGFENDFREGIDFIINGEEHNKKLSGKDKIHLHRGSKLEIYFSNDSLSFKNYFSAAKDGNMKNLISVYLSNLNATISNNLDNLFYGCKSLKSVINLNDIKTLPLVNMSYMFYNCTSLELIDLSAFNTSLVENMVSIFENCISLKYLDISHFDLGNLKSQTNINSMFRYDENLKYINVYNVQDPNKLLLNYKISENLLSNILIVCQKEKYKIMSHDNIITKCCYYEMSNDKCEDTNFITLYYGKDVEYTSYGNDCNKRTFSYVINSDHNTKLSSTSPLKIKKGHKFEIYFTSPLDTLEEYFSPSCDPNMKYIVSVDLSNFDTSKLTNMKLAFADCELLETVDFYNFKGSSIINMNFLFSGCVLLKSIDFSYLEPSSVANMNGMFSECTSLESIKFSSSKATSLVYLEEMFNKCSSLKSIDLSMFIITSAINMDYMFYGCSSLKYLDISNFNIETVINPNSIFDGVMGLKYINLHRTKDNNDYISKSELNNINNLIVCQTEPILIKDDLINQCCKYNITTGQCEYSNYIELYYGEDVFYKNGDLFNKCNRTNIDYIMIGENHIKYNDSVNLDIEKNTKVEIHFKSNSESLSNFFCSEDENTKHIVSIDLTYLDTSKLKDISLMFSGCSSIKKINLEYFNTSSVTNMSHLFEGCALLESIDLSNLETSSVKYMSKMFYGCTKLTSIYLSSFNTSLVSDMSSLFSGCSSIQSLDLSNFNTKKVSNFDSIFSGCTNLKVLDISNFEFSENSNTNKMMFNGVYNLRYINLYHTVDNTHKRDLNSSLAAINHINVCQNINNRITEYENITERCCYYNILSDRCENSNYIVVKYGKFDGEGEDTIKYEKGFEYSPLSNKKVREGKIDFIIYENKKYSPTDELNIKAGSEIEIYLTNVTSLESFFSYYHYDENAEFIESIDFSHLDASNITNMSSIFSGCVNLLSVDFSNFNSSSLISMKSMFSGCESIESINLSNLNTSLVTDMSYLFDGCEELKYIYFSNINTSKVENMAYMFSDCKSLISLDLSYFDTSSLTDMEYMFEGCETLEVLDISHFNLDNITNHENIFINVGTLRYIDLYYVEDRYKIIQNSTLNNLNDLIVCQKEEEILSTHDNNREKRCCYFNITLNMCQSNNYIILYYGKESEYRNGFINKYRNGVSFIINGDYINTLPNNGSFRVNPGCKIELYFNSILTSLESFFDYNHDINVVNIKSIDFSHYNSSLITDMSKAFSGCASLESINFDNFNFSSVINMNNLFFGCDSLKSINLTLLDVSKVTDMSYMFYSCDSLKSINTTYFNISSITKMNYMFYRCISLESIDFSFYPTSSLINLEKTFYGCKNLISLNLSKFDTSLVTNMKEIFYGNDNLVYIDISNFNMEKCEYYSNAFSNKNKIVFINVFNVKYDKIASKEFRKTNDIIFICQSEDIIKNKKAINCCEFNFEYNICENMPTIFVSTYFQESTFIRPQSTIFTDKTIFTEDKLMTTNLIENDKIIDSTFAKEKTDSIIKTTYIPEETEGFTDFRSTIFNKPTTFIIPETKEFESSFLEERSQSTTNVLESLFNTSKIETTLINIPKTNPIIETTSSFKETTRVTPESSTQSVSTNENAFPSTDIKESDLKTISFTEIPTSIIKETIEAITKTSSIVHSTFVPTEKRNILITSLPGKMTVPTTISIDNQQITSNFYSTSKEEITEKNTYVEEKITSEREEIKTSDLVKIPTTELNINIKTSTNSKVDTTITNIGTTGVTTSNVNILETTKNINVPTTFIEGIVEPITSKNNILETTNEKVDSKEISTSNNPTTSEPKQESTISQPKQEPTAYEPKHESTISQPKQEPTTSEPTTSEPKQESTISQPKDEPTTSNPIPESTTSEPKNEPITSEVKNTQYSIVSTSINKPKTETILSTVLNHINLTSIASKEIQIPTTIIESKIKTTITGNGSANVVLLGLSNFSKFISYFTFCAFFRTINGFILSNTLTMSVQLINNRLLRILQNHQVNCKKINEDLENVVYLCTVVADVSTVSRIKLESDFIFDSPDIKVIGISPTVSSLMNNLQNATGEYDTLLQSNIYILDHSNITQNKRKNTFNITGIIGDQNFNLSNIDLVLKINLEKEEDTKETDINCTIFNINSSNYTLNCLGEKNILYNLQSAVSFFNNDTLLINFDENTTSKIIFNTSRVRKKDTNGLSAGAILVMILVIVFILAINFKLYYF